MQRPKLVRRATPQRALARRAIVEEIDRDRRSWIRHGIAGLAVAGLGLAVAGSVALTGSAVGRHTAVVSADVAPSVSTSTGAVPSAFAQRTQGITRRSNELPLDGETIDPQAAASAQAAAQAAAAKAQKQHAVKATSGGTRYSAALAKRQAELKDDSSKTEKLAKSLAADAAAPPTTSTGTGTGTSAASGATSAKSAPAAAGGKVSLPITTGYHVAARFGQVGVWARYHTGFDFACPIGTPVHAIADGVVTNSGPNSEAGWAGNYVTVRHADGKQTLYAHLADTSVGVGEHVTGGQLIGHVGMTGRSFGPHVHVELYPAGITPGDVYKAINPVPWMEAVGLHP